MICFPIRWQPWCAFKQVFRLIYTVNLFKKANHRITYKEDLKVTWKRCVLEIMCFSLWFRLWCFFFFFYNRRLKKHIILFSKCTSRLVDKRIHIKLVSRDSYAWKTVIQGGRSNTSLRRYCTHTQKLACFALFQAQNYQHFFKTGYRLMHLIVNCPRN